MFVSIHFVMKQCKWSCFVLSFVGIETKRKMFSTNEFPCRRKALIICNQNYKLSNKLDDNLQSIDALKTKLRQFYFEIEFGWNLSNEEIDLLIEKYFLNLNPNDFLFFYYFGYAMTYENENYLIGINDEHLVNQQLIKYEFIHLDLIIDMFNKANASSIIYLFEFFHSNSIQNEFQRIQSLDVQLNQLICLLSFDETNSIERKNQSLLLNCFVEYIDEKYLPINQMFDLIQDEIVYSTGNRWIPLKQSLLRNNLYFNNQIQNEINDKRTFLSKIVPSMNNLCQFHFNLTNKQIKDSHMKIIVDEYLMKNPLKKIYFDENQLTSIGVFILSSYLQVNNDLEGLYLNDNRITDIGIKYLSNSLINNQRLKYLSLQKNQLTDGSIDYFVHLFATNRSLICLSLDFNRISDKGVDKLLTCPNLSLKYIGLSNNVDITDGSLTSICRFIETNCVIEDISLFNCHLSKSIQLQIQKIAKKKKNFSICLSDWNS